MRPALRPLSLTLATAFLVIQPRAAGAAEGSPDASEKSSLLYKEARALQIRGKWAEAETKYQAAWDLRHTFDIAGNLGDCEMHVGQPREAAEHLSYALKNAPAGILPEQSEALKRMLREAKVQVGTLHIAVNVRGAEVLVDGKPVEDPAEVYVDPGPRTIEARLAGYGPATHAITVRAGAVEQVALALVAPRRSLVPGAVLGGVAGASLIAGIATYAAGRSKASSAQGTYDTISKAGHSCVTGASNYDPACPGLESTASTSNTLQRAGVGLWIGAGAAAAATVLWFALPQATSVPRSAGRMTIAPVLTPGTAGLTLRGTL